MQTTPYNRNLLRMVEEAVSGTICLPQFQRNFVWRRDDVQDLLLSVVKGYYIGSLLLLKCDSEHTPFAPRAVSGLQESLATLSPDYLILDGQQRLTSLHYAFAAPNIPLRGTTYPYRFFLDLKSIVEGEEFAVSKRYGGIVFSWRSDLCEWFLDRINQFEDEFIPFTEIPQWDDWILEYEKWLIGQDQDRYLNDYFPRVKPVWFETLNRLKNYQVPTIDIRKVADDDLESISEVCAIFEKLNSTGMALSVFDLLTARLYRTRINGKPIDLHALWKEVVEEHHLLHRFSNGNPDVYGLFILRTLALLRGREVRSKMLINLVPERFPEDWRSAALAVERALVRLTSAKEDGFGVFNSDWQPYTTMVPIIAAVLQQYEHLQVKPEAHRHLQCWYWGSVLLERYASSVETVTYRDYQDLVAYARNESTEIGMYKEIRDHILDSPGYSLRDVTRKNSIYRAMMNLVAIHGAKDFASGQSIEFHELEDHHIFPRAFLKRKKGIAGDEANTILNRTLIAAKTNRKISKKSPSKYVETVIPREDRRRILASHLISEGAEAAMENDDYHTFLAERDYAMIDFLSKYLEPARQTTNAP